MDNPAEYLDEVQFISNQLGLAGAAPIVLSDAGSLILHLAPHPVVARIAKPIPGGDPARCRETLARELDVARHLLAHGIPAVPFATGIPAGPHPICGTWMTLWRYVQPAVLPSLSEEQVIDRINEMAQALVEYNGPLPVLGAWGNAAAGAETLLPMSGSDPRVAELLDAFYQADRQIRNRSGLVPAHGDAHPGNLIPSGAGWLWNDFEDVSLMPEYWDLASYLGNTALFHGLRHRLVEYVVIRKIKTAELAQFLFVLKTRAIFATTTNLAMATCGRGDLEFALSQLDRIHGYFQSIDAAIGKQ
jgi:hypothetical protein